MLMLVILVLMLMLVILVLILMLVLMLVLTSNPFVKLGSVYSFDGKQFTHGWPWFIESQR